MTVVRNQQLRKHRIIVMLISWCDLIWLECRNAILFIALYTTDRFEESFTVWKKRTMSVLLLIKITTSISAVKQLFSVHILLMDVWPQWTEPKKFLYSMYFSVYFQFWSISSARNETFLRHCKCKYCKN